MNFQLRAIASNQLVTQTNIWKGGGSYFLRFGVSCLIPGNLSSTPRDELKFPDIKQEIIAVKSYNKFKFMGPSQADARDASRCYYFGGKY
jgi:hypothetical protein